MPYLTKQIGPKITRHWVGPLPTVDYVKAIEIIGTNMASRYAGVSRRTVQRWVKGKRTPTPMQRNAVAIGLRDYSESVVRVLDNNKEAVK